jgi:hypothetical protein
MLFHTDEDGRVDRLDVMQFAFYKRPYQQSLKFKAAITLGSLAGMILYAVGRKMLRSK